MEQPSKEQPINLDKELRDLRTRWWDAMINSDFDTARELASQMSALQEQASQTLVTYPCNPWMIESAKRAGLREARRTGMSPKELEEL